MVKLLRTTILLSLVILLIVPAKSSAAVNLFEDVDMLPREIGWFNQDLEPRAASNPGSTSTTTTASPTNSAGFPVGPKPTGTGCTASAQCDTGNCQKSVCRPVQPAGSYGCYKDQNCGTGSCNNGKCVPKAGTGVTNEPCNGSYQCASGSCSNSSCQPKAGVGSQCYKASQCSSGHCNGGSCATPGNTPPDEYCTKSSQCTQNNFCNRNKCAALGERGAGCYKNNGCYSGKCRSRACL